jgi:hypothetical protein
MGMGDFRYLLGDVAKAFREDALWGVATIAGRFRIDPFEVPLGAIEPGLGVTQISFACDRAIVPKPWPAVGDHLTIRNQVYEITAIDEDDIGELAFRLIRHEIGISTVTSEGVYSSDAPTVQPRPAEATPPPVVAAAPAVIPAAINARSDEPRIPTHFDPGGRPSRRREIAEAFDAAVTAGVIDPARPLKELCAVMHQRLGNGEGLSSRTLRRVVGGLVRERRKRVRTTAYPQTPNSLGETKWQHSTSKDG